MPTKSQTKSSKNNKFLLSALILVFIALIVYLGFEAKTFFNNKAKDKIVDIIKQNGFRIEYSSFTIDNPIDVSQVELQDVTLRKINSSLVIKTPSLSISIASDNNHINLSSIDLYFSMETLGKNQTIEIAIDSDEDVNIHHHENIFDFQLPKSFNVVTSDQKIDGVLNFQTKPKLVYTVEVHENTGEIINKSAELHPNNIFFQAKDSPTKMKIENQHLFVNYNNLGFNRTLNLDVDQIFFILDENNTVIDDMTTDVNIDLDYKATLATNAKSSVKINQIKIKNNKFQTDITADVKTNTIDLIPTGLINIHLSSIDQLLADLHHIITNDEVAPQFIKSPKYHTVYNMNLNEFNHKAYKFAGFLNKNDVTQSPFNLEVTREKYSTIMLNDYTLEQVLVEFDKIFFGNQTN